MKMRFLFRTLLVGLLLIVIIILLVIVFIKFYNRNDEFITLLTKVDNYNEQVQLYNSNRLLDLTDFSYLIQNDVCENHKPKELLAIIIVTSYVGHDELRAAHRRAIPQNTLTDMGFKRVFLLSSIPKKEHFITQAQILNEQERFHDLLQGSFQEDYRNLSYKHIMGLRWASTECQNAKFIVKIDDDIIYDIFHVRSYLERLASENEPLTLSDKLLAGYVLDTKTPVRNQANKWYVSEQEYPWPQYPSYLSGWLYIANVKTALRLVDAAMKTKEIFWIDDTWVTGILREKLNIRLERLNSWYSANAEFLDCCVRDLRQFGYECEYFIGPNGGDPNLLVEFLNNVKKCYRDANSCMKRPVNKSLKETCVGKAKHIIPPHGEGFFQKLKQL